MNRRLRALTAFLPPPPLSRTMTRSSSSSRPWPTGLGSFGPSLTPPSSSWSSHSPTQMAFLSTSSVSSGKARSWRTTWHFRTTTSSKRRLFTRHLGCEVVAKGGAWSIADSFFLDSSAVVHPLCVHTQCWRALSLSHSRSNSLNPLGHIYMYTTASSRGLEKGRCLQLIFIYANMGIYYSRSFLSKEDFHDRFLEKLKKALQLNKT